MIKCPCAKGKWLNFYVNANSFFCVYDLGMTHLHILWKTQMWVKMKIMEKKWLGGCSLIHNTSGVERHVEGLKLGQGRMTSESVIHVNLHKLNNKLVSAWLEHFWCMYKPWAYMDSQNSPWPRLGEATTFPFIIFYMISHGGYI
jgi:hypothetical protein